MTGTQEARPQPRLAPSGRGAVGEVLMGHRLGKIRKPEGLQHYKEPRMLAGGVNAGGKAGRNIRK